jgi:hypothetical protein
MPIIPATWEAQMGRIIVQGQTMQKAMETPYGSISLEWWYEPVISTT